MKEKIMGMKYTLAFMLTLMLSSALFVSCGDDEEVGDKIYYSAVFTKVDTESTKADVEMAEIKKAFSKTLGVDLSDKKNFDYTGSLEKCDSRVRNACYEAKASLAGITWEGSYVFTITNENTDTKIFEYSVGPDKEE